LYCNENTITVQGVELDFFPLDERLGVVGESWSKGLQRLGTWLAVRTGSYQSAVEGVAESIKVEVSKTSLWRVVQATGAVVEARLATEAGGQGQLPSRGQVVAGEQKQKRKMGLAADGVYIHLIGEGWKEVKVGAAFEIVPLSEREKRRRLNTKERQRTDEAELRERVRAEAVSYCAVLGSVDEFEPYLWAEACRRYVPRCWDTVLIGDGAEWIDGLYQRCYYDSIRIVDWYHACEHLAGLARQTFGDANQKGQHWLEQRKNQLWRGEVQRVVNAIHQLDTAVADREREAAYFSKHARAMTYLEFCEMGLPVGSGVVEGGGCKGVVEGRLKRVGMRWSRAGAKKMLALCCEYGSGRWEQIWAA
jgi:hypothetical protein